MRSVQSSAPRQGNQGAEQSTTGTATTSDYTRSATQHVPMASAALALASRGFSVLPLNGKIPLTSHGVKDAASDPQQVQAWWSRWPEANIGARPGAGYVVLDIDPRNGGNDTWHTLTDGHALPDTPTVRTGSGGSHYWYRLPAPGALRGIAGAGVDVKHHGGYLVMPPSVHPDTGQRYLFASRALPAMLPGFLARRVYRPVRPPQVPVAPVRGGSGVGLVRAVSGAVEGSRNSTLFWAACRAHADGLSLDEELTAAALAVGLDEAEINRTLRSARQRAGAEGRTA